jgi:hypothetical protein
MDNVRKQNNCTQFLADILFNDEAVFVRDGIVNLMNDNPHTIFSSKRHHRLSISVWVGVLYDQLLGLIVLTNKLTDAAYHRFLVNDLLAFL